MNKYMSMANSHPDFIDFSNKDEYDQKLLKSLNQFRKEERFCDVSLSVNGLKVPAHRIVLAVRSPYFEAMFSGNFQETSINGVIDIDLSHVVENVRHLEIILEAMYNGRCLIAAELTPAIFHLASFFMFEQLQEELTGRLVAGTYTSLHTIIQAYILSITYNITVLQNTCLRVIDSRFHDYFIYQDEILALPPDQMKFLFSRKCHIYCSSLKIILFLLRWTRHNQENCSTYIKESLNILKPILHELNPDKLRKTALFLESTKGDEISEEFCKTVKETIITILSLSPDMTTSLVTEFGDAQVLNQLKTKSKCLVLVAPDKSLIKKHCEKEFEFYINKKDGKRVPMAHITKSQEIMKLAIYDMELENWFEVGDFLPLAKFDNKNNWKAAFLNDKIYFMSLRVKICYYLCLKTLACQEISLETIIDHFEGEIKSVIPLAVNNAIYCLASNSKTNKVIPISEQLITEQKYFRLNDDLTWSLIARIEHFHNDTPASLINAYDKKVITIKASFVVSLGKNLLEIKDGHVFDTVTSTIKKFAGPCYLSSPVRLLIKGDNLFIIDAEGWKRQYDWAIEEWTFPEKIDLTLVRWCRSVASDSEYPCLSHVATNSGDAIWEIVNHGAFNSYLLKIDIDDNGDLLTSKCTPPPFRYFTLVTAGLCSTGLLKSLKDSQFMDLDND